MEKDIQARLDELRVLREFTEDQATINVIDARMDVYATVLRMISDEKAANLKFMLENEAVPLDEK